MTWQLFDLCARLNMPMPRATNRQPRQYRSLMHWEEEPPIVDGVYPSEGGDDSDAPTHGEESDYPPDGVRSYLGRQAALLTQAEWEGTP